MSSRAARQSTNSTEIVERVVSVRKAPSGNGQQFEIRWQDQEATTWEAASRIRRQIPLLVQAFEAQQQQQQNASMEEEEESVEGAAMADDKVVVPGRAQEASLAADGSSMQAQLKAMQRLIREQGQQLQQLRASPSHPPQPSLGPASAPIATPPVEPQQSRFARKEPRAQDLREYDGAAGAKLDEWLQELARAVRLFQLNDREAVDFGVSRLTAAALQWSLALSAPQQTALVDAAALGAALRARFQPVTAARLAREQLRALRHGSRSINDYIADFQRLHAQLPSMAEEDALFAFEAGVNRDIAVELRKQRIQTVADAISLAAHIGSVGAAAPTAPALHGTRGASIAAAQMEIDDDGHRDGVSLDDRIQRAVLNAMQSQALCGSSQHGIGTKAHPKRGYNSDRGGARGGRGGRFGNRGGAAADSPRLPKMPGVPEAVVEQRRAAGQCYRCGSAEHTRFECTNASSASTSAHSSN
jgi:hypothetical protein